MRIWKRDGDFWDWDPNGVTLDEPDGSSSLIHAGDAETDPSSSLIRKRASHSPSPPLRLSAPDHFRFAHAQRVIETLALHSTPRADQLRRLDRLASAASDVRSRSIWPPIRVPDRQRMRRRLSNRAAQRTTPDSSVVKIDEAWPTSQRDNGPVGLQDRLRLWQRGRDEGEDDVERPPTDVSARIEDHLLGPSDTTAFRPPPPREGRRPRD